MILKNNHNLICETGGRKIILLGFHCSAVCLMFLLIIVQIFRPELAFSNSATAKSEAGVRSAFISGKKALEQANVTEAEKFWKPILGEGVYGPVAYLLLAKGFAQVGSFSKSESLIRDYLKLYPTSPYREAALEELTEYVYRQGKPEAAGLLLSALPNASESRKQTLLLQLGDIESSRGSFEKALTYYRKLYINYPAGPEGLNARERISRLAFNRKIKKPEFTEDELLNRSSRLSSAGRYDMASEIYLSLSKQKPQDSSLKVRYARCLYKDRQNELAIKVIKELLPGPLSDDSKLEALYILSLVYWRIDKDAEFESCNSKILEMGPTKYKKRVLANMAAFNYEKGRLSKAESYFNKLLSDSVDSSTKAKVKWRLAWIKYRSRRYTESAEIFREMRQISQDQQILIASKYWQARSLTMAGEFEKAEPLFRSLAENTPFDYYGSLSQNILRQAKKNVTEKTLQARRPFPDLTISPPLKSNSLVSNALRLVDLGLPEFALLNLQALPNNIKSNRSIMFLMAKAAHNVGYYGLAHEIIVSGFSEFVNNPPSDAPREFIEIAYPRVHLSETSENAARGGVNPCLVWAIVRQESRYDAFAVSPAGALGLMQVTPKTALIISNRNDPNKEIVEELLDPRKNLSVGIQVLSQNLKEFKGSIVPAIAAYNADINKVRQWVGRNGRMRQDEFIENIPFAETRLYVKKVLANFEAYKKIYAPKDLAAKGQ
jgi:soluble lytic murein transglycosylase